MNVQVFIILPLIAFVIWLLSFLGVGLSGLVCDLLTRLGALSPWPAFEPWLAFLACSLLLRLLLLPFQLNHARINQKTVEPMTSPEEPDTEPISREPDHPIELNFFFRGESYCIDLSPRSLGVAAVDSLALFIIARALNAGKVSWAVDSFNIGDWLLTLLLSPVVLIGGMLLSSALLSLTTAFANMLAPVLTHRQVNPACFIGIRAKTRQEMLSNLAVDFVVYAPVFLLMLLNSHRWTYLLPLLACCTLAKAVSAGAANFISRCLDWHNDAVAQMTDHAPESSTATPDLKDGYVPTAEHDGSEPQKKKPLLIYAMAILFGGVVCLSLYLYANSDPNAKLLVEARAKLASGEWRSAASAFRKIKSSRGSISEVNEGLLKAESMIATRDKTMASAESLARNNKWHEAEASCKTVLSMQGFNNDQPAMELLAKVRAVIDRRDGLFKDAASATSSGDLEAAKRKLKELLAIPGFKDDTKAVSQLKIVIAKLADGAKGKKMRDQAMVEYFAAIEKQDLTIAQAKLDFVLTIPGYETDEEAVSQKKKLQSLIFDQKRQTAALHDELKRNIRDMKSELSAINSKIANMRSRLSVLTEELTRSDNAISDMEKSSKKTNFSEEGSLSKLKAQRDASTMELSSYRDDLKRIEYDLSGMALSNKTKDRLNARRSKILTNIENCTRTVSELKSQINSFSEKQALAISTTTEKIKTLKTRRDEVSVESRTVAAEVRKLNSNAKKIKAKISELESQLGKNVE